MSDSIQKQIEELRDTGALFVVSHSGGKDSQAMYAVVCDLVPADQIIVVHADLGEVEWAGLKEHITANISHELLVARAVYKDGSDKGLLDMIEKRGKFPSSSARYCTSDLKRDPIMKVVRRYMNERGLTVAVNCMGLRAEESCTRAKAIPFQVNKRETNGKRTIYDWLPIKDFTEQQVWDTIRESGQVRHKMYDLGMTRLSCCFCVLASKDDLTRAAKLNHELYEKYVALEKKIGHTVRKGVTLEELTGIKVDAGLEDDAA